MKRFIQTVGLSVFVLWLWHGGAVFAAAEPRIALVIGNSAYKIAPPLPNPANDAKLMAETLRGLGFDVIERIDADRETILLATFELQDRLIAAGNDAVGLFFYAGHGVQVGGENYFIPLGTEIMQEREVSVKAVSASFVLKQMEFADNRMNFVILDACRNNPFPASTRATTRGLARMQARFPVGELGCRPRERDRGREERIAEEVARPIHEVELHVAAHLEGGIRAGKFDRPGEAAGGDRLSGRNHRRRHLLRLDLVEPLLERIDLRPQLVDRLCRYRHGQERDAEERRPSERRDSSRLGSGRSTPSARACLK